MPERVTIREAASRLGVSDDTIRRRIARGVLHAERDGSARNARILVQVDEPASDAPRSEPTPSSSAELELLRAYVGTLREQVDARTREVSELHVLLERQTRLLSAGMATEPTDTAATAATGRPGPSETPRSWLGRLFRRS